jgi:ketosteroid isomerase-like protein
MQVVKTTVLVTMSLCAVIACAQRVSRTLDTTADEAALRAADDTFVRAYNSGDLETVVAFYAEDAVLQPDGAPAVRGREAIREYFRSAIAVERKAVESRPGTLSDRAVGVSGDMGWSSGENKVIEPGGAITWSGKFLSVSRKVNGKWLYIRDTWNSDTPTPPAH